jgi:plastocyanin
VPRAAPPPRRFLRRGAALAFAVALATLTACGGSADEGAGASGSSSGSPSESSSGSSSSSAASSSASGDSDSASSSAPAGESHQITATEEDFSIALDSTDLAAGDYEIEVVNNGGATHDLVVEKDGEDVARSDHIAPGDSGSVSVSLEPGQYVFYCSIGAHRALGMEIEVTVT